MNAGLPRDGAIREGAYLYPVRVYYEDTDAGGMVYHANYLKFAERARTEMLRRLGIEQDRLRADSGFVFVVRRCTIDFALPARLDDDLVIVTRLASIGGASLDLDQEVRRDGVILVRLALQVACIGRSGRPHRLPQEIRAAFASLNDTTTRMVTTHAR
ncbi:MAG TPA: tol-pal system-associated acyl-CoA thioesterase [Stellaceae bacterium]|nr:tol-pal system-associated acyl-CoA thioesterase [Stellaceae bacterium]